MRLKYYLRGLGIGIIVTAILLSVSGRKSVEAQEKKLSQNEFELTLAQTDIQNTDEIKAEDKINEADKNDDNINIEETGQEYMADETAVDENSQNNIINEDTTGQPESEYIDNEEMMTENTTELPAAVQELLDQNDYYILEIVRGDDSATVARKLKNAGIVTSASEFDAFLMQHGYDKKITTGKKYIPWGASWLEIAGTLAKN